MPNLTKPKAIIFDWDNTIVDTWELMQQATNDMMEAMGKDTMSLEKIKASVHKSMRDALPALFGDKWQYAAQVYQRSYHTNKVNKLKLLEHARELLDYLKQQNNLHLAVVSNKLGDSLREEVKLFGFNDHFAKVIGSQDAHEDKPSPIPAYLALEGSGIICSPDVWFIGDSIVDMECAHRSGCVPIFFGPDDFIYSHNEYHPSHHFKTHHELLQKYKQLN